MNSLNIEIDWMDPAGARGAELRATWGELSIAAGAQTFTEVFDERSRSVRNRVFAPVYPLAEWVAANWWFLLSEVPSQRGQRHLDYSSRHNTRFAREGYAIPAIEVVPLGDCISLASRREDFPSAQLRFLADGEVMIARDAFCAALSEFVDQVVARLSFQGIEHTRLQDDWDAIQNADRDEREFCEAAASIGCDPYAMGEQSQRLLIEASKSLPQELLTEFLPLTDLDDLRNDAQQLADAAGRLRDTSLDVPRLRELKGRFPALDPAQSAWKQGYEASRWLRREISHSDWKSTSLDDLSAVLAPGVSLDELIISRMETLVFLDALVGWNRTGSPAFAIQKHRDDSKQFALCRALFEYLTLPDQQFAIVSELRTMRQQRNRAFAAEFLAPASLLSQSIGTKLVGDEEVEDLADAFGVSSLVIRHQLHNHGIAQVVA